MKFKYLSLIAILFMTVACSDDEEQLSYQEQLAKDIELIDAYLDANGINAIEDASGLRYVITKDSVSEQPQANDVVVVDYEGMLLSDGKVFDKGESIMFSLTGVISGFQIGLQKFSEGETGTLYIPSGLAYGTRGQGPIPANANLIFDIKLIEVK